MTKYLQYEITVAVEDGEDVDQLYERLDDGMSSALCHGKGEDHVCDYEWSAGGRLETEEQMEERWRLEDMLADLRKRERREPRPEPDRPKRRNKTEE